MSRRTKIVKFRKAITKLMDTKNVKILLRQQNQLGNKINSLRAIGCELLIAMIFADVSKTARDSEGLYMKTIEGLEAIDFLNYP